MKITERVAELIAPAVEALGFELYDVEFNKEYGSWELLITIDAPEAVTLDDCEKVSRGIEPILDKADPIEQAYFLTVSSVGIDRPLKLPKDFDRNIGNKIDVKLYTPLKELGGKKNLVGTLVSHDEESFTFETDKGSFTLAKKAAALLRPHIDF
ncbi:MAG: ribosome maturation factor RimP [Clostridia bacterium]|nr:ribosome maturation factor RimP [Clostridia bacterium]